MSLGSRITNLRLNNKWSQSRLSREVKTNVTSVQKWENDTVFPSAEKIIALAKTFHVSSDYLLGLDDRRTIYADSDISPQNIRLMEDFVRFVIARENDEKSDEDQEDKSDKGHGKKSDKDKKNGSDKKE